MELKSWGASDVGRQRDHNEDNFLIDRKLRLYIVAPGMGGHAAGEVASSIAVHEVRDSVLSNHDLFERFAGGDQQVQVYEVLQALEHAIQQACGTINKKAQAEPEKRGMGTTCSLLLIAGPPQARRGFIAHVGDSRVYLVRQGHAHLLTEDHSLMNELVRRGKIKKDEIDSSPYARFKNAVTRAVGVYESVEVDTFDFDVLPGDNYLLCSDGMYAYLEDGDLADLLTAKDLPEISSALVDKANQGGGHDNITVVCVRVPEEPQAQTDTRAEEFALKLEVLGGMPLFKYLSYAELVRVMNLASTREFATDELIFEEGEPGDAMYVVLSGVVRLDKGDQVLAQLDKGDHFGEMALVDRSPRSLSAIAAESTRALSIGRGDFYELIRKEPDLSVKLLWSFVQVLADRLRKTNMSLSNLRDAKRDDAEPTGEATVIDGGRHEEPDVLFPDKDS
jgi:serine/threonine protein phosphatase PrpC/CRP-like cAMP-binding protein